MAETMTPVVHALADRRPPAPAQATARAPVSALERLVGAPLAEWAPGGVSPFPLHRLARGTVLIHEGATLRCVYLVQAGEFKVLRTAEDGYEQVLDFAGRLDLLGYDGLADGHHATSAVALEDASVYAIPVADLQALRQRQPAFDNRLQAMLARQIGRLGEMAWLMAAVGADRRTARFLLQQSRRMAEQGQSPCRLHLRMCRRDIASHLGLAHESISRSLSFLAEAGYLRVDNREVEILDLAGLQAFARLTRGLADAPVARGLAHATASRTAGAYACAA
ncbi:MAG: Crp/Fnr family transcriptional regulator [Rhizobacter sp.]|nr:Crp/Fnr family transcriptional regulator [Rhizobacter sp.]